MVLYRHQLAVLSIVCTVYSCNWDYIQTFRRRVGLFTLLSKAMNMPWQDAQNFTAAVETQCQSVFLNLRSMHPVVCHVQDIHNKCSLTQQYF
jgi:hypothetical protein